MLGWLAATAGVGLLSALVPAVNMEAYLVTAGALTHRAAWPVVAVAAATGQMAGKMAYYYAARGGTTLGTRLLRRHTAPTRPGRLARWTTTFADRARGRPVWACLVLLASGALGIPPLLAMSIVSGSARVHALLFLASAWTGRVLRFGAVLAVPALLFLT